MSAPQEEPHSAARQPAAGPHATPRTRPAIAPGTRPAGAPGTRPAGTPHPRPAGSHAAPPSRPPGSPATRPVAAHAGAGRRPSPGGHPTGRTTARPLHPSAEKHNDATKLFTSPIEEIAEEVSKEAAEFGIKYKLKPKQAKLLYTICYYASGFVPLAPAIVVMVYYLDKPRIAGYFLELVETQRSSVQVVVSFIASVLTYMNILVISKLMKAFNFEVVTNPIFMWLLDNIGSDGFDSDKLKYKRFNSKGRKVNFFMLLEAVAGMVIITAPHFIWIGALTPNIVSVEFRPVSKAFSVPDYSQASASNWADNNKKDLQDCLAGFANSSFFSGCAAVGLSGSLFYSIAYGYMPFCGSNHSKPDNSSYTYSGRSYGVGSAVGLWDYDFDHVTAYDYNETGFLTTTGCIYNESAALGLSILEETSGNALPSFYGIQGMLPNSDWNQGDNTSEGMYAIIADNMNDAVGWSVRNSADGSSHMLGIAAGNNFANLNNIQCNISFVPWQFRVRADSSDMSISVDPLNQAGNASALDPRLANTAVDQLNILSQVQYTLSGSQLGSSLTLSAANLQDYNGAPEDGFNLTAIEYSVAAALDDILGYVAASQYFLAAGNASTPVDVVLTADRVQLGTLGWDIAAIALASILAVGVLLRELLTFVRPQMIHDTTKWQPTEHGPVGVVG